MVNSERSDTSKSNSNQKTDPVSILPCVFTRELPVGNIFIFIIEHFQNQQLQKLTFIRIEAQRGVKMWRRWTLFASTQPHSNANPTRYFGVNHYHRLREKLQHYGSSFPNLNLKLEIRFLRGAGVSHYSVHRLLLPVRQRYHHMLAAGVMRPSATMFHLLLWVMLFMESSAQGGIMSQSYLSVMTRYIQASGLDNCGMCAICSECTTTTLTDCLNTGLDQSLDIFDKCGAAENVTFWKCVCNDSQQANPSIINSLRDCGETSQDSIDSAISAFSTICDDIFEGISPSTTIQTITPSNSTSINTQTTDTTTTSSMTPAIVFPTSLTTASSGLPG